MSVDLGRAGVGRRVIHVRQSVHLAQLSPSRRPYVVRLGLSRPSWTPGEVLMRFHRVPKALKSPLRPSEILRSSLALLGLFETLQANRKGGRRTDEQMYRN